MIRSLQVVIPACNEAVMLPRCLASVQAAMAQTALVQPEVALGCTVVLDSCRDGSAGVVQASEARGLVIDDGLVGVARHVGAATVLAESMALGLRTDEVWIACTDADTVVPVHWLSGHLELAAAHDAVIGTVEPLGLGNKRVLRQWRVNHRLEEGHPHVHGANLGIRGSTYRRLGGFRALGCDEDIDLVERLRAHTDRWVATDTVRVRTSARRTGRLRGGFSDYLSTLRSAVENEAV